MITPFPPATAVIDGTLCQLTRQGARAAAYTPLATAVVEFRPGPLRFYVREHPYGLLPGLPNLYCLDANLRLLWMAEWPVEAGPCAHILSEQDDVLVTESSHGVVVRLHPDTGQLLGVETPLVAAS